MRPCWSEKPTDSPARRVRRPPAPAPSTARVTGVDSSSRSAPPRAASPPGTASSSGWIRPYSGRGAYSTSTSTCPSVQVRRRSSTPGEPAPRSWPRSLRPTARASTSTAEPVAVRKVVSRAIVWSRYRRATSAWPAGRTEKWPASSSSSRPNTLGASKRGKHSQSTDPARLTSAAERQSDSRA